MESSAFLPSRFLPLSPHVSSRRRYDAGAQHGDRDGDDVRVSLDRHRLLRLGKLWLTRWRAFTLFVI
jgi:hypothetical protein